MTQTQTSIINPAIEQVPSVMPDLMGLPRTGYGAIRKPLRSRSVN